MRVRVVCVRAYHALFMRNMLVDLRPGESEGFTPDLVIFNAGGEECSATGARRTKPAMTEPTPGSQVQIFP